MAEPIVYSMAADDSEEDGPSSPLLKEGSTRAVRQTEHQPCADLELLFEQLRSNMDAALRSHYEELKRCAMAGRPSADHGLSQSQLDSLTVGSKTAVSLSRGGISPFGQSQSPSHCSSAKPEPKSAANHTSTLALYETLGSPSQARTAKHLRDAATPKTLDALAPPATDDNELDSLDTRSTRSSSSPSHLRGISSDPLSSLDNMSGNSQDDCNSKNERPVAPADAVPPGIVRSPTFAKSAPKSPLHRAGSFLRNALAVNVEAAGVALEDSPAKSMYSSNASPLAKRSFPYSSNGTPFSPDGIPSLTPASKTKMNLSGGSSLSLDTLEGFEDPRKSNRKSVVFSPLSKRKLAVLEAKQSWLQRVVKSRGYELVSAASIVFNVVFIALETDLRAMFVSSSPRSAYVDDFEEEQQYYSFIAANVFSSIFVIDLLLRIHSERTQFFFSREKGWNAFDIVVVLTSVVEVIVHWYEIFTGVSSNARAFLRKFSMLRIVRLLRVISHTRNVRVIRFIRELRLMVFSLTGTLKSLLWAVVLMFIILLVFGVFFTDGAVTYLIQNPALTTNSTEGLRTHFGSLSSATVSLYMAMSGGEDWGNILNVLKPLPIEYHGAFLAFITFAILALLNVITAVFVEAAMQVSQNDKELVVLEEMESKLEFISVMQQVFQELDTNDSGALSLEEFEKHIEDPKLTAFLASFELDVSQVRTLFTLLDVDRTGEVDLEEFVSGCLRLKGGAKSLDMAILKYQVEWIMYNVTSWEGKFETQIERALCSAPIA